MLKNINIIYCDMDGVLADFNAEVNAIDRFKTERGFFKDLQVMQDNLNALKVLMTSYKVKILSTSPNNQADRDKFAWLMKHLPNLMIADIIFTRPNRDKADYVPVSPQALLIDDYTANLKAWADKGGSVLKLVNKYDSVKGKHTALGIEYVKSLKDLL